jgi:RND superfamily putative drug exporter
VLQGIARLAITAPKRIIVIAMLVMVATGIFGIPVTKSLSAGGFQDPTSESAQASKVLVDKFAQGDMELLISVTSEAGAQSAAARAVGADIAGELQASPYVQRDVGMDPPPSAAPALVIRTARPV